MTTQVIKARELLESCSDRDNPLLSFSFMYHNMMIWSRNLPCHQSRTEKAKESACAAILSRYQAASSWHRWGQLSGCMMYSVLCDLRWLWKETTTPYYSVDPAIMQAIADHQWISRSKPRVSPMAPVMSWSILLQEIKLYHPIGWIDRS